MASLSSTLGCNDGCGFFYIQANPSPKGASRVITIHLKLDAIEWLQRQMARYSKKNKGISI